MKTGIKKFFQMLWDTFIVPIKDYRWLGWIVLLSVFLIFLDPQGLQTMRVILYVLLFWLLAGVMRKIHFPYRHDVDGKRIQLKLSDFIKSALEGNVAAAIVALAYIGFMVAVAWSFLPWIRGW